MKVLLVDFYDSFTFNIFHYLEGMGVSVTVWEDKAVILSEVAAFDCIILSPGPGLPDETTSLLPILQRYASSKKILGVCLGMQGIALYFQAQLFNQKTVKHGVETLITPRNKANIFHNLPDTFPVGLYHSWAVDLADSTALLPLAYSTEGVLMAVKHVSLPIYGVQFHPESILTPNGKEILENFIFKC